MCVNILLKLLTNREFFKGVNFISWEFIAVYTKSFNNKGQINTSAP